MFAGMNVRKKIAVGMSGGVDSSVAAALLREEGHEVVGISMAIFDAGASELLPILRHQDKFEYGCLYCGTKAGDKMHSPGSTNVC